MYITHKSIAILEVTHDGVTYSLVDLGDRLMFSGGDLHQVFMMRATKWEDIMIDSLRKSAVLFVEGTVNNKRAAMNVSKIASLSVSDRIHLVEKIESCDCAPSVMRRKLRQYFNLSENEIAMLDLEDEDPRFTESVRIAEDMVKLTFNK